ncbi:MAG: hypothetical protein IJN06_06625 [Bacteroidales bacterium]|nr:hypothetical protein [Bacteroidales bacterium]
MAAPVFIPANAKTCINRIVGNDIEDLIKSALTYIHRSRDFYEESIRNDLKRCGASIVSYHASIEHGLKIYYDPNREISLDDLATLSGSEMFRKYPKFHPVATK